MRHFKAYLLLITKVLFSVLRFYKQMNEEIIGDEISFDDYKSDLQEKCFDLNQFLSII